MAGRKLNKFATHATVISFSVIAAGALVWHSSNEAFSIPEDFNRTSDSASVIGDPTEVMFNADGIFPGYKASSCTTIESETDFPTTLKMFAPDVTGNGKPVSLPETLQVKIFEGTGSADKDCAGFVPTDKQPEFSGSLDALGKQHSDYDSGLGTTLPAGESKSYKVTISFPEDAPNSLQGTTAGVTFTWGQRQQM